MAAAACTPHLGVKRMERLTVREAQGWLNRLVKICLCCAQGEDAKRKQPKCCAFGECCGNYPGRRVIESARATLRAPLNHAMREELVARNVVSLITLPTVRKKITRRSSWTVDEARKFLEWSRNNNDHLYPLWVLILVLRTAHGRSARPYVAG
jgi:hypothetical protein